MSYSQAIFLAIIQGLTEFLPVSSSGHLVIFQKLFNLTEPPVLFDVLVHVGTLGAILVYSFIGCKATSVAAAPPKAE